MEIQPCSNISPRSPVGPKTNYEKAYNAALHSEIPTKKKTLPAKLLSPHHSSSDIILNGKPSSLLETTIESAVENNMFV